MMSNRMRNIHSHIAMFHDSYVPLTKPELNLHAHVEVIHYCENAHLLRCESEHSKCLCNLLSGGLGNKSIALQSQIGHQFESISHTSRYRRF